MSATPLLDAATRTLVGDAERYTYVDPLSGVSAWVEIAHDPDCLSPIDPDWAHLPPRLAMLDDPDSDGLTADSDGVTACVVIDYRGQRALLYFDDDHAGEYPDPERALRAYASELSEWEAGECYCAGTESRLVCGFVGERYALEEAEAMLRCELDAARSELREAQYWASRDVVTA